MQDLDHAVSNRTEETEYAVELLHITKTFGGFVANEDVTIQLKKGEIHALLGENGAGKSTLMNVLFGLCKADSGEIRINGCPVEIRNPNDATSYGIGMVHQHFKQVESFTVLENIILGKEDVKDSILQTDTAREKILELSRKYRFEIDPDAKISDITIGMQQRVEILKMLYRENEILIFDEPTAVLTPQEIEKFLQLLRDLAADGKSILFITHKLNEIKAVADRCSVLRKGKYISTFSVADMTEEKMSELMVGRKVQLVLEKSPCRPGKCMLQLENVCVRSSVAEKLAVDHVSMEIRGGEIVCIAGIDGNGQSELIKAITGLLPVESGKITLDGEEITGKTVRKRTLAGLSHVPEDRLKYGLIAEETLQHNMILQAYYTDRFQKNGFLDSAAAREFTTEQIQRFDIAVGLGPDAKAGSLSGGNQQKAVIARELARDPKLFIAAQPIRGLDVGAIENIHSFLLRERDAGRAVLLLSFELSEVMNLSDRILIMFEGRIVADVKPEEISVQQLGLYMAGGKEAVNETI